MKRWLSIWMLFTSAQVWAQALQPVEEKKKGIGEKVVRVRESETVVLGRWRYVRFEVEEVHPEVSVALVKRWVFGDTFPQGLLRKVKGNPRLKPFRLPFSPQLDRQAETDSGYMRWAPQGREGHGCTIVVHQREEKGIRR